MNDESVPTLNHDVLQQQAEDLEATELGAPIMQRLVATFVENARATIPTIRQKASEKDLGPIVDAAHQLKSGALFLGAEAFVQQCRRLEQAARRKDLDTVRRLAGQLPQLLEKTHTLLEEAVGPLSEK